MAYLPEADAAAEVDSAAGNFEDAAVEVPCLAGEACFAEVHLPVWLVRVVVGAGGFHQADFPPADCVVDFAAAVCCPAAAVVSHLFAAADYLHLYYHLSYRYPGSTYRRGGGCLYLDCVNWFAQQHLQTLVPLLLVWSLPLLPAEDHPALSPAHLVFVFLLHAQL